MAIDKRLKIYDNQGNEVDYDILATDVKFANDGKDLPTKLAELEEEIGEGGGYEPPVGGIPKTDLASDVQASLGKADTALQSYIETDPTVPSWAKQPSKPGYNVAEITYSSGRMLSSKLDEMDAGIAAASDVDSEMSDSSTKAVQNKVIKGYVDDGLADKVDKETGKGLSTNDYTDADKSKLAGIAAGAEVNVQSDWSASSGDAAILNKPTLSTVATSGSYNDLSNQPTIKDVWVTTPSTVDGTFTIHVGDDEYVINLNHTHPQYQPLLTAGANITIAEDQQTGNLVISAAGGSGGGISGINMNGNAVTISNGVADLGTVITQHQSLSGYAKYVFLADEAAYTALSTKESDTLYLIPES